MNRDGTPRFPLRHGRDSERFLLQVCDQPITCSCLDQSGFVGGTLHDRTVIAVQIHSVCDLQAHQRGDLFLIHRGQKRYSGIIVLRLVKASDHDQISLSAVSLRYLCHFPTFLPQPIGSIQTMVFPPDARNAPNSRFAAAVSSIKT